MKTKPVLLLSAILFLGWASNALGAEEAAAPTAAERDAFIQAHRAFWLNRVEVEEQGVHLSFYLGHWYHRNRDAYRLGELIDTIRIYRRTLDFHWSWDRSSILDGQICDLGPDDLIYEGPLKPQHGRSYDYYDTTAEVGNVYAYFVAAAQGPATGPIAVKIRDPEVWWTKDRLATELAQLQADYPDKVKLTVAGTTHRGFDIPAVIMGDGPKKLALVGAIHASESGPELIVPFLRETLEHHADLLDKVTVLAIPNVNIDERERAARGYPFYLRRNVISVDLNRNFPADWEQVSFKYGSSTADPHSGTYRGPAPTSEPETQAVVSFLRAHRPDVLFSYHHLASVAGKCLWAPGVSQKDETYAQRCQDIYDAYDKGYSSVPVSWDDDNKGEKFLRFAGTGGSLGTFCYREFGAPAFDVERHWKNDGLDYSGLDHTTPEDLQLNQRQHAAALLEVMRLLSKQ